MSSILVVDDEYAIAESLRDLLEDEGYRVVTASNGREALERMTAERPELVLLDIMMPVMDGRRTLEQMAKDPKLADVSVVLMSAAASLLALERPSNVVGILQKPFSLDKLFDIIAEQVGPAPQTS